MKEKKLYTCEICNKDYADKEKAIECEKTHKLLETATIVGEYNPITVNAQGLPQKIRVKFKGYDSWVVYGR